MPGTTSEAAQACLCSQHELTTLLLSWQERIRPVLAHGIDHGRAINPDKLWKSSTLLCGIKDGLPESFAEEHRELSHHLPECPLSCPADQVGLALLA